MRRGGVRAAASVALLASAACGGAEIGRDLAWQGPVTVAESGASNPTVAMGAEGSALVAWVGAAPGAPDAYDVYLARLVPTGGGAESPVRVNDVAGSAAPHAQAPARVAVDAVGGVHVVWVTQTPVEGRRFPASDLEWARSDDGGRTFVPARTVNDDTASVPATHTFHDVEVVPGGVMVSWLDSRARWQRVAEAVGWRPGDPPPGDAAAEQGGAAHHHGGAAGEAAGGAGMAAGAVDDGPEARVAFVPAGGSPGASTVVAGGTCPCCRSNLAAAPDGTLYAAWRTVLEGNVRDIVVARSDDAGASWGEARRVHADGWVLDGCPHAGPGLAVGPDGELHVTWYTGRDRGPGLYYARSTDRGATFSTPLPLIGDARFVPPSQAVVAALADGTVLLAWEARDEQGEPRVRLGVAAAGRVERLADWSGSMPDLQASGERWVLAWLDGEVVRAVTGAVG